MDASKYSELRTRLQQMAELDNHNLDWFRMFLASVMAYMNNQHGVNGTTCRFGLIENGEFVADQVGVLGSSYEFAVEVKFSATGGSRLFSHVVPFKAVIKGDSLVIKCIESGEIAEFSFGQSREPAARQTVAMMVDGPVIDAVEKAFAFRSGLTVD